MPDQRYFERHGPVSLTELIAAAQMQPVSGGGAVLIERVAPLHRAEPRDVSFLSDRRYLEQLRATKAGACFVTEAHAEAVPKSCIAIITTEPQAAYARAAGRLHTPKVNAPGTAIDATASIGEDVRLGAGCVVGAGAEIGARCDIGPNAVIGPGVRLGEGCSVGPGASVGFALIGARVRIAANAVIGEAGFGVAGSSNGTIDIPQLGRVIIEDDVSIGANSCVDRGAWEDTVIGQGSKIDNLVQIAHNCRLGRFVLLAGHVGLSGSVTVGDGVQMGGSVGVADHLTIGAGVRLAARAGVMHDVPAGEIWAGAPAKPIRKFMRESAWLAKMAAGRDGPREA